MLHDTSHRPLRLSTLGLVLVVGFACTEQANREPPEAGEVPAGAAAPPPQEEGEDSVLSAANLHDPAVQDAIDAESAAVRLRSMGTSGECLARAREIPDAYTRSKAEEGCRRLRNH